MSSLCEAVPAPPPTRDDSSAVDVGDDGEAVAPRRARVTKRSRLSNRELDGASDHGDDGPTRQPWSQEVDGNESVSDVNPPTTHAVVRVVEPGELSAAEREDTLSLGRRAGRTKVFVDGYEFTQANKTRVKITYRCSFYRSQDCKARLHLLASTMEYDTANMIPHTCIPPSRISDCIDQGASCLDLRHAMQQDVDNHALAGNLTPHQIWMRVSETHLSERGGNIVVRALTKNQVIKRVHNVRASHYGADMHGRVEVAPLSRVLNSNLSFFQFHHVWHNPHLKGENKIDRVIGWAHPTLLTLLRYENLSLFIDATFRCVPVKFKQCVVLMVYDKGTKLYVPVCYVLAASKTYDAYWNIFQYIRDACGESIKAAEVVCDFETALVGAVSEWFEDARVIGCFFHFKQACQRRMVKYRIPKDEISVAMEQGVLDMLTVVDREKIFPQGVSWVKATIRQRCQEIGIDYSKAKWREFWAYFQRTWIQLHPPTVWNIHGIHRSIVARTNNPLERFNRELNAAFATPHPSVPRFVNTVEAISRDYVRLREQISRGQAEAPARQRSITLPTAVRLPDTVPGDDQSSDEEADLGYEYQSSSTDDDAEEDMSMLGGDGVDDDYDNVV